MAGFLLLGSRRSRPAKSSKPGWSSATRGNASPSTSDSAPARRPVDPRDRAEPRPMPRSARMTIAVPAVYDTYGRPGHPIATPRASRRAERAGRGARGRHPSSECRIARSRIDVLNRSGDWMGSLTQTPTLPLGSTLRTTDRIRRTCAGITSSSTDGHRAIVAIHDAASGAWTSRSPTRRTRRQAGRPPAGSAWVCSRHPPARADSGAGARPTPACRPDHLSAGAARYRPPARSRYCKTSP